MKVAENEVNLSSAAAALTVVVRRTVPVCGVLALTKYYFFSTYSL